MSGPRKSTSIKLKILGTVGACLIALAAISGFAIVQIFKIGQELAVIAEADIPLSNALTKVTSHQLEQTIQLEKILKYALQKQTDEEAGAKYKESYKKFHKYGETVDRELLEAEEIAKNGLKYALTDLDRKKFEGVYASLKAIEDEHKVFESHVTDVVNLIDAGKLAEAMKYGYITEAEAEKLDLTNRSIDAAFAALLLRRVGHQQKIDALTLEKMSRPK